MSDYETASPTIRQTSSLCPTGPLHAPRISRLVLLSQKILPIICYQHSDSTYPYNSLTIPRKSE
ncbi:hypothetical protein CA13_14330 [Planctomycetes bacterium CA13]|uniref:Uncharacterized protein n=1 Tax=Novipirellula herctigrandis TaxID=2527986 RepID=A0A5C5YZM3_9BACT|nr:hypothetical protein CA13_14330 [Planctomycetes bacterium CA13]